MSERDPRIDPMAGDVTKATDGSLHEVVAVMDHRVHYHYTPLNRAKIEDCQITIGQWRKSAKTDKTIKRGDE